LTEPLRTLANKVFEVCRKDSNPEFVIDQVYYLVTLLDLPEEADFPDVIDKVATMFLDLLGSENILNVDIDDVSLYQESNCPSPSKDIDNKLTPDHPSTSGHIDNQLCPSPSKSILVCSSPSRNTNGLPCPSPSKVINNQLTLNCSSPSRDTDSQAIQIYPSPSGIINQSTQDTAFSATQDLFPDFKLTEASETLNPDTFLTPSISTLSSSFSTPFLTSVLDLPSESDSDVTLQLSDSGPTTRQCPLRKFIKKIPIKEPYFQRFCKAVSQACGLDHSKDNIKRQCTLLISKNSAASIPTMQNNFGVQGIIQRIVPKVAATFAENKKAQST